MIKEKVVVIGGGVGGLTAAHELIERDFEVEVFERRTYLGGKAASQRDSNNLPKEHGFRFFPSWYRHLPDTLTRIPCRGTRPSRDPSSVADRLVPVHRGLLAFYSREPMPWVTHVPRSVDQARTQANFVSSMSNAGLAPGEVALIGRKLAQFFAAPDSVRLAQWENVTWWDYMECDGKSAAYQTFIAASTKLMVAAQPKAASAYTIGRLVQRTFSDAWTTVDRVLDGPTSEAWIDPWVDHIKGCGAKVTVGWELERIVFCSGSAAKTDCGDDCEPGPSGGSLNTISHVVMSRVTMRNIRSLRTLMASLRAAVPERAASDKTKRTLRSCGELATAVLADREWSKEVRLAAARNKDAGTLDADNDSRLISAHLLLCAIRSAQLEEDPSLDRLVEKLKDLLEGPGGDLNGFASMDSRSDSLWGEWTTDGWWPFGLGTMRIASARFVWPIGSESETPEQRRDRRTRERQAREAETPQGARTVSQCAPEPTAREIRQAREVALLQTAATVLDDVEVTSFALSKEVYAQYFVFALPLEQMAYYANRTPAMTFHDARLKNLLPLTPYVSWMAGIQFYLKEPCHVVDGHLLCMDSEWSLTAIEQTQFWGDTNVQPNASFVGNPDEPEPRVKAVLSVDISTWDQPGRFVPREALNCTRDEIAREVWGQLKASVTRLSKSTRLRDDMLLDGWPLRAGINFNLDDNVVDIYDVKKQAEYEKARGLDLDMVNQTGFDLPYIYGPTREFNAEPMLLSGPGSRALRPEERTGIENMFLAADYIQTDTDLACMEGANEAGRRAANAVLQASGSLHPPCHIWSLSMTRDAITSIGRLFDAGTGAIGLAAQSARTAGHLFENLLGVTGITRLRPPRNGND